MWQHLKLTSVHTTIYHYHRLYARLDSNQRSETQRLDPPTGPNTLSQHTTISIIRYPRQSQSPPVNCTDTGTSFYLELIWAQSFNVLFNVIHLGRPFSALVNHHLATDVPLDPRPSQTDPRHSYPTGLDGYPPLPTDLRCDPYL
ncbi:hypothetical protein FGO68_gene17310 [Halteria grandinella]|uniref:Uncharacterized protein n=1 Tax=Halteria grandinella TaxID=5974 RepID=A0A8J8NGY5_HALGN|nr:hypothetical protein FGO68_gene17310 [Halteria grandinella]